MENSKKKSTENEINIDNTVINDTKKVFYLLHKVRIRKGIPTSEICGKIGIHQSAYSRYINSFESQNKVSPKLDVLSRFAEVLGYEIRIVEKKIENEQGD
jgi:transcriptional regulator with XRE-family HTH domain